MDPCGYVGIERSRRGRSEADPPAGSARVLRFSSPPEEKIRDPSFGGRAGDGTVTSLRREATPARRGRVVANALPSTRSLKPLDVNRVIHRVEDL